jgi:hypothetical protein
MNHLSQLVFLPLFEQRIRRLTEARRKLLSVGNRHAKKVILCLLLSFFGASLSGCRNSADNVTGVPAMTKEQVIAEEVGRLFDLGFSMVRIDRLSVEGVAVAGASRGSTEAGRVSGEAASLSARYSTNYVAALTKIRKYPRAKVEAAAAQRYNLDPGTDRNRLVYPTLKSHLMRTFSGLTPSAVDAMQDYESVRYTSSTLAN